MKGMEAGKGECCRQSGDPERGLEGGSSWPQRVLTHNEILKRVHTCTRARTHTHTMETRWEAEQEWKGESWMMPLEVMKRRILVLILRAMRTAEECNLVVKTAGKAPW